MCERCRRAIAANPVGTAIGRADRLLYQAKLRGRDRIETQPLEPLTSLAAVEPVPPGS